MAGTEIFIPGPALPGHPQPISPSAADSRNSGLPHDISMHDTRISGAQMRTTSASGAPMRRQNELGSPWKHHPARELVGASQPFLAGKTDYASIRHDQVTALMHTPIDVWTPIGVGMWVGAPRESRGLGYPHEARLLEEAAVDGTLLLMLDDHGLQSSVGISSAQVRADILGSIPALRRAQQEAQERELENKRVRDAEEALLPAWAGFQSEHNAGDGRRDDGLPQDMGLAPGGASHAQSGGLGGPPGGVTAKSMASEAARRADYRREMQQMIQEAARGDPDAARRRDAFYRALKMNKALDAATESALRVLELRAQLEAVEGKHRLAFLGGAAVKGVAPGAVPAARGPSDGFGPRVDGRQAAASVSDEAVRMKPWGPRATGLDNKGRRVTSVRRADEGMTGRWPEDQRQKHERMRAVARAQARVRSEIARIERAAAQPWDSRHHLDDPSSRTARAAAAATEQASLLSAGAAVPGPSASERASLSDSRGNTALHVAATATSPSDLALALRPHLVAIGAVRPDLLGFGPDPGAPAAKGGFGRAAGMKKRKGKFINYMVMLRGTLRKMGFPVGSENVDPASGEVHVDLNVRNAAGETPLLRVVLTSKQGAAALPVIRMLLWAGADPEIADKSGRTALLAAAASPVPQAEIIEALLDGGASVGAADRHGRTVMHHLAACPHPSALRALQSILSRWRDRNAPAGETRPTKRIEGALDVNRRDSEGRTPLHVACSSWLNALHLSWQGVARNGGPAGAGERSGRRPDWGAGKGAGLGYAQERMRPASGSRPGTADGRGATGDMWLRKRGMKLRASRVDRSWEKREDGSAGEGREGSREGVGGRSEAEKGDPKAHAPLVVWVIQELIEAGANVSAVVGAGLQSPERSRLGESTEGEMRNGGGQNCVHLAMQCLVQAANEVLLAQRREREVLDSRGPRTSKETLKQAEAVCAKIVAVLGRAGANMRVRAPGPRMFHLLHLAALAGSRIAVKALVEADAARDVTDKNGDKPTHLAAKRLVYEPKRYASTIVELAKAGVSMEARGSDDKTVEEILKGSGMEHMWGQIEAAVNKHLADKRASGADRRPSPLRM